MTRKCEFDLPLSSREETHLCGGRRFPYRNGCTVSASWFREPKKPAPHDDRSTEDIQDHPSRLQRTDVPHNKCTCRKSFSSSVRPLTYMENVLREAPRSGASAAMAFCHRAIGSYSRCASYSKNKFPAGRRHQATQEGRVRSFR